MRMMLLLPVALGLAACNQSQPAEAPEVQATDGTLEPRINMAPVDPAKAKAVMHERHEGMERNGKLFKQLGRDMKSEPLNLAAIRTSAASINDLAQKAAYWFPAGTGPDVGKTGARPEIWQKPQDFAAKMAAFQKAAATFHSVARGSNAAATSTAFGDLGKSCKACHDLYRNKMKH